MPKKNLKQTSAKLNQQLQRRALGTLVGRLDFLRSNLYNRLAMMIPTPLRWIVPFLEDELGLRPPSFDDLVKQLRDEQEEEEIPLEIQEATILEKTTTRLFIPQKYRKYICLLDNPFNCKWTEKSVEQDNTVRYCVKCGFPAILAPERKIQGRKGRYEIQSFIGHRNEGRLYHGIQNPGSKPVIIKEYLLPKIKQGGYFNDEEIAQRKILFERLAGLKLADGREIQDFRLITPYEAIADTREERCYIVIKQKTDTDPDLTTLYQSPTLASYLDQTGALNNFEVWRVLNQVLQSLEFLHSQKFKHPDETPLNGVVHGNVTLESLLITFTYQGFFIYLSDFAVWENRFELPGTITSKDGFNKDLNDLGKIAFYLLAGTQVDPETYELLDPEVDKNWPKEVEPEFKKYILNLIGLGLNSYHNATEARQALHKLSLAKKALPDVEFSDVVPEAEPEKKKKKIKLSRLLLYIFSGILGVALLGFLIWFFGIRNRQEMEITPITLDCCIAEVAGLPQGQYKFTAEESGLWNYVYKEKNLIVKDRSLQDIILEKQPTLTLDYLPENDPQKMFQQIKKKEVSFAITSLIDNLEDEYDFNTFAHDGLVIFVPFGYGQREDSLPRALRGKISFTQVRDIYIGEITNWRQLGGPNMPIKLYLPPNDEAIAIFEQKILKEDRYIKKFRELMELNKTREFTDTFPEMVRSASSFQNLTNMIRDFEQPANTKIGGIGFDSLSKVFGQCSVYPLAIDYNFQTISPLLQRTNNKPISPQINLCQKGTYIPNVRAFITRKYPLAYPLSVVYLKDNSQQPMGEKFAEILITQESQEMLFKTGLVPIQPLE